MKLNSANWRDVLPSHPAAELLPRMTKEELLKLGNDIKANGLISPIALCGELIDAAVHEEFKYSLLDGISRLDAMDAVGIKFKITAGNSKRPTIEIEGDFDCNIPEPVIIDGSEVDPYAFVLSANLHRRHLSAKQKRDLVAKMVKAQPSKSNRQIAKTVGVSHPYVATVRAEVEKSGDVETVTTSIDTKGRKQPAKKKRRDIEDDIAEKKAKTAATKDDDAPGVVPRQIDPDHLISQFTAQVRSSGLDIARQIGACWPMFVERLREVVDEIESWANEAHRLEELTDLPTCPRRNAP